MAEVGKLQFIVEVDSQTGITSIKKFNTAVEDSSKVVETEEKKQTGSFDKINAKAVAVAAAVGAAALKMAKSVISATGDIESGRKTIVQATGATGEALESLMTSAKNVYATADESFGEVSTALGEINTRFGLVGEALEDVTGKFLDFAEATGQDVQQSVVGVSQVMNQWGIDLEGMPLLMDKLVVAGQETGVSVGSLSAELTQNAGTLQAMGYSMDEAIAMLMSFEKQGIDSASVLMGMKQSFAQSAKAGTDARADWETLLDSITNATDETVANSLAVDTFGNRIATTMVSALRNGKLNFDEFTGAIENAEGALVATDEAGKTTADRIEVLKHQLTLALSDIGAEAAPLIEEILPTAVDLVNVIFDAIKPIIPVLSELVKSLLPPITELLKPIVDLITKVINILTPLLTLGLNIINKVLSPVITVLTKIAEKVKILISPIQKLIKWLTGASDETEELTEQTEDLNEELGKEKKAVDLSSKALQDEKRALKDAEKAKSSYTDSTGKAGKQADSATASINKETDALKGEKKALDDTKKATDNAKNATTLYGQEIDTVTGKITEQDKKTKDLQTTTQTYADKVKSMASAVTSDIGSMTHSLVSALTDSTATVQQKMEALQKFTAALAGTIGDALFQIGQDLYEGQADWSNLGKAAVKALSAIVRALAEEMTARAVLAVFSLRWGAAAALTAGAAAAYIAAGMIDGWANSLSVGSDYIPYDDYPARLHRGEMVLTRQEADRFRDMGGLYGIERQASVPLAVNGGGVGSVNVNSNLSAVIEVDGVQLGVAVLKNIDSASQFVLR